MKLRIIYSITGWLLVILMNAGCSKVFDHQNIGAITPGEVWNDPDYASLYVNNFYSILPAWNRNESFSEEAGNINTFLNGKQQASSGFPDGVSWETAYTNIRAMNTFFENIDRVAALDNVVKAGLKGQVYFFRAYQYYRLVKVYGGVPVVTTIQNPLEPAGNFVTRESSLACFNYIVRDLDSAISLLPPAWSGGLGRITKMAAMAVKGQVLMLKASPLFSPVKNQQYWQDAYDACNAALTALNAGQYGLYTASAGNAATKMWYDKTGAAKEMVLFVRYSFPVKPNTFQAGQRPLSVSVGASGVCQPTWEMVRSYPMLNGKNIDDPTSGYNESYFWVNRDPRFDATIVYHGAPYGFATAARNQWNYPSVYPDGYQLQFGTQTGFYSRKSIDTTLAMGVVSQQAFDWPVIRYAEVLLDVAECANEIGNATVAREHIILIRKRAGIVDDGSGSYGLSAGVGTDAAATLDAVMKERQIEFAYEGKRFWDLRRRRMFSVLNSYGTWHSYAPYLSDTRGTAADTTGQNLKDALAVTAYFNSLVQNPPAGVTADSIRRAVTNYKVEVVDRSNDNSIKIPDDYYFWPLNPNWLQKDPKLVQNIGWDNGTFDPTIH